MGKQKVVAMVGIEMDLYTAVGIDQARLQLERRLRETQHALAAVEMIMTCQQLQMGLLTTQEAMDSMQRLLHLPALKVGDNDYITGLTLTDPKDAQRA